MDIYFQAFSNYAVTAFKEIILPTLTAQQKKICLIAALALGFLAASYLVRRYCFNTQPSNHGQQGAEDDIKKEGNPLESLSEDLQAAALIPIELELDSSQPDQLNAIHNKSLAAKHESHNFHVRKLPIE